MAFALEAPSIGLPKGGGALRSIDEQFSVNPSNGTVSLTLPLPFTPGRAGLAPPIRLQYDGGAGNSVVGLGWALDFPTVQRRTDRHVPTYSPHDSFSLAGGDELVPVLEWDGADWVEPPPPPSPHHVRRFRPRVEREFARIEQIGSRGLGTWWRVTSRDNVTTIYGHDDQHRIADPENANHVLEWLPSFSFDDRGNVIVYDFAREDLEGVAPSLAEVNRSRGLAQFVNRHLKRVHYGNRTPYAPGEHDPYRPAPPAGDFLFEAVFDYGEHDPDRPAPDPTPGLVWPARDDPFSSRRGGFDVRTYRLLRRVLMFHRVAELNHGAATLVRSLDLTYESMGECSHLAAAAQHGYLTKPDGTLAVQSLPTLDLFYEPMAWDDLVRLVDPESTVGMPSGVGVGFQWMDLYGEGISGVFTEQAGAWWYKRNLGAQDDSTQIRFDTARLVAPRPSPSGMTTGILRLQDLDSDGYRQVVIGSPELQGWYERDNDDGWGPFTPFEAALHIDLQDRHMRLLDVVGDGHGHLVVTEHDALVWYRSVGRRGHEYGGRVAVGTDEERGPAVVFADTTQSVFLADMTGDGLTDIVRIRNGDICYWPNLGYGRFGARVAMDGAPRFDHDDLFDTDQLRLADITGTGAADLVHIGRTGCHIFLNLAGNRWDPGHAIAAPFPSCKGIEATTADLLGTGTTSIVWSSSLPDHADAPLRYVDPSGGRKPHLLRGYVTNLGKEVVLTHRSSTWHYLQSEREGRPWRTRLPFPVHCVSRVETHDRVRGSHLVTVYRYHHGRFDAAERELRGFGLVEQTDAEQFEHWAIGPDATPEDRALHPPPTLTRTWFHTGELIPEHGDAAPYRDERWDAVMRRNGFAVTADEAPLPDTRVLDAPGGDAVGRRELLRACKGAVLRTELFALDAPVDPSDDERRRQLSPYSVTERNSVIRVLQPRHGGHPAALAVFESESIGRYYERTLEDPRVEHTLHVRLDELGNVVESAVVSYRRWSADPVLPAAVQELQAATRVLYTSQEYTGDIVTTRDYRLRVPSRRTSYELRGIALAGAIFAIADFDREGFHALTASIDEPDPDAAVPPGTVLRRRLSVSETAYYNAALTGPLPLHQLDVRALRYESYELAITADMAADVYEDRVTDAVLTEGGYVHRGDVDWWVPSGRLEYLLPGDLNDDVDGARARFFVPVAHADALGTVSRIRHHGDTWLVVGEVEDAAGNRTTATAFDWRALVPTRIVDPNGNSAEVLLDELGRVKAAANVGKGEGDSLAGHTGETTPVESADIAAFLEAETSTELAARAVALLRRASVRFVYDTAAYADSGGTAPAAVATITREQFAAVAPDSPVQVSFQYSNGNGGVELHKVQAEPGVARRARTQPDGTVIIDEVDTGALDQLRWVGNGRKVLNDKGQTVKEYEPYFSVTHRFESAQQLVASGVAILRMHDPLGRPVRADHPDGTHTRIEPGAWCTVEHDRNDTVTSSEWHRWRVDRLIDADLIASGRDPVREEEAANMAAAHADTPFRRHLDSQGRPVLEAQHNGFDAQGDPLLLHTLYLRDIQGRARAVVDARGIETITYRYDLRGALLAFGSADDGPRWMLADVRGEPLRSWDGRAHEFACEYDEPLRRLTRKRVRGGDGPAPLDRVVERRVYGEELSDPAGANLRTRTAIVYDTAGKVENHSYDLAGNLMSSARRFLANYRDVPDWSGPLAGLDGALEPVEYRSVGVYDALGRVLERTTADGSVYRPGFNAANLLETVTVVQHAGPEVHVKNIDYDERGRRRRITYGNDVVASYDYDRDTGRLRRLTTRDGDGVALQDLRYTYDPVGNVTHLVDGCVPTVWFNNHMVDALSRYTYDPVYRLTEATGREHIAQVDFGAADNWADTAFRRRLNPNDTLAWRGYTQSYSYDPVGNIDRVVHSAGTGSWTRRYSYAATSNRLESTQIGATTFTYQHQPSHGQMTAMPHLSVMRWDFRDELHAVATQVVAEGNPETTWYVYDGEGRRVRKVTDRAAPTGAEPVKRADRNYLDGVEIAFEYNGVGAATTERHTFHVMDDHTRVALIETESEPGAPAPDSRRIRYQAPDHLGSAHLETDETGTVVAYEVFHPFGTTAYQATETNLGPGARRYRYTGMERDDESGLAYHGARYYAPWLGRWTAPDKHPDQLDGNRYAYVKNNPLAYRDPNGLFEEPVHGALTYRLAIAAGFTPTEAAEIAIATAGMDHDAALRPGDTIWEMQAQILTGTTQRYHYPSQERALELVQEDISLGVPDLREFGRHLHSLQDVGFKDAPGPHNRSSVRLLGPTVAAVGVLAVGVGVAAAFTADAAFSAGGAWAVLGALAVVVAVAAFAFALYALVFALVGAGTGHPTYLTEDRTIDGLPKTRLLSAFWSHAADRAFEDPIRNTQEMRRVYEQMKRGARARNPNAISDDAAAEAAIRETVGADTSKEVNDLFNAPVPIPGGGIAPSYTDIRRAAPWSARPPDVSLSRGTFVYDPNRQLQLVP
ncbi:SpvB/TcaC N-terminal domain-containing protein [Rhodococcus daqingensis]|uniref:SpvB/TcaC N-terminal domain-containing protein n=1 Tax=Rhodococcus daqingensis TaxID=2479363 RepID=A0ABW2RYQ7_9NOCA